MTTHLEYWGEKHAAAPCGSDDYRTERAESVTCAKCRRWIIRQWVMWAEVGVYDKNESEAVTHWPSDWLGEERAMCGAKVSEPLDTCSFVEFVSCAHCQYALLSTWEGREQEEYLCGFCGGITTGWQNPEKCAYCKKAYRDYASDPEYVTSVENVIATVREHVNRYRDQYGQHATSAEELDDACRGLSETIGREWEDQDRIYLPSERQLDMRIDGCTARQEAA